MFLDAEWKSNIRLNRVKQILFDYSSAMAMSGENGAWQWTDALEEEHMKWCCQHEINPTAVRSISESSKVLCMSSTRHNLNLSGFDALMRPHNGRIDVCGKVQ